MWVVFQFMDHKCNNVQGMLMGFESGDANVKAVAEAGLMRDAAIWGQRKWDDTNASMKKIW